MKAHLIDARAIETGDGVHLVCELSISVTLVLEICVEICTVQNMMRSLADRSLSVSAANVRGVSGLVRDAEEGRDVVVERFGKPVAAIVGVGRLSELIELEADLRSAALVLARASTDTGARTELDEVISSLGFDRVQLESELNAAEV